MSDMYERIYFQAQEALDEILGPNEEDGAGEGLVAEIWLVAKQRDEARAQVAAAEERGYQRAITDLRNSGRFLAWFASQGYVRGDSANIAADYLTHLAAKAGEETPA